MSTGRQPAHTNVDRFRSSLSFENGSAVSSGPVTVSVSQQVKRGQERLFEAWLQGVYRTAEQFPGHQGITVIRPSGDSRNYTYIFRFDSYEHLQQWEVSAEKDHWTRKLIKLVEAPAKKQVLTGLEYWFTLPGTRTGLAPPRYKMVLLTIPTIFLLTTLLGLLINPGLLSMVRLLKGLAVSVAAVMLMTYVVMPRVTRLFGSWLFPKDRL